MASDDTTTPTAPTTISARLSSDRLRLLVDVPDPHGNLALAASRLAMELPDLELAETLDHEAIAELLTSACEPGEDLVEHPLVEGQAPVPPRDGAIEWARDFFAEGFSVDEDSGQVDYWERAENRAVGADEQVAVLLLPLEGTPGLDLQGNEISVTKPASERLRAGKGIRTEETEDRVVYRAEFDGRLSCKDGTVSVEDVYAIKGDVSLATGNIRHKGTVIVSGDVREGATIETDGNVMIKGMVEPCNIICGGDLIVGGGILGDSEHALEVGGAVQARYLNEVTLRCGGDLTIVSQIDHSQVSALGRIDSPRGRIAGGVVKLYRGGRVGQAGAAGSTGTVIEIGANWRHEQEQAERRQRLQKLQDAREKLAKTINHAAQTGALDDGRRDSVLKLQAKLKQVDEALQAEGEAHTRAAHTVEAGARRELGVLQQTYPGVTFRIGQHQTLSDRHYEMPRLVALRRDKVRVLPLGELNQPE